MSGNALEEGVLQQLHSPSHSDPARIVGMFGAIVAIVLYLALGSLFPALSGAVKLVIVLVLFFGFMAYFLHRLSLRRTRREAKAMEEARTSRNTETERQLAQMKKSS